MISVAEAQRIIRETAPPGQVSAVPLASALGLVLARDLFAPLPLPPFANAAMDGFAVRHADLAHAAPGRPVVLAIAAEQAARRGAPDALAGGTACRIMTGAAVPPGADAVVAVEATVEDGERVAFRQPVASGTNIRPAGEDVSLGARVLEAGRVLNASCIALLAGLGFGAVPVHRPPRVAIVATGDELVEPGDALGPGQIYNCNTHALAAMVREAGGEPLPLGVAPDDREGTCALLAQAREADLILTTGGVSMGRYDFVGSELASLGTVHFERVAQQPGKPFTYATVGGTPVYALPGNPVAGMVCFEVYVRPVIRRMLGIAKPERERAAVALQEPFARKPGRTLFLRARVAPGGGGYEARLSGLQGSAILSAMAAANALLVVPAERGALAAGERLEAMLLDS